MNRITIKEHSIIGNLPLHRGAETLVARIVSLLTEREQPTKELVKAVRKLHYTRQTDIRSLIPILNGLNRDELMSLIPKFVLEYSLKF